MKFKIDENLPEDVTRFLQQSGHDSHSVLEENLVGAADKSLAQICRSEARILLTLDLDFADIRLYPPGDYPGIIVLRLIQQDRDSVLRAIPRILQLLDSEQIENRLWIVDETRTRIRGGD